MYCNKMPWGHGAYGVEAASQLYFAKSVEGPHARRGRDHRRHHPEPGAAEPVREHGSGALRAATTRSIAWRAKGYITRGGRATPPRSGRSSTRGAPRPAPSIAPYFIEAIRTHLEEQYGAKKVFEDGLIVKTGLDPALQRAANRALDSRPARARQDARLPQADGERPGRKAARSPTIATRAGRVPPAEGDIVPGARDGHRGRPDPRPRRQVDRHDRPRGGYAWTNRTRRATSRARATSSRSGS